MLLTHLTPIRAVRAISIVTTLVTLASGAAMHLIDPREFPTVGRGLWWAAQTVTTVGYGDVVPHATAGRALALAVMVCAVAFLTVVTGSITAALIQLEQRRLAALNDTIDDLEDHVGKSASPSARADRRSGADGVELAVERTAPEYAGVRRCVE